MSKLLIAAGCRKRVGKDTFANFLMPHLVPYGNVTKRSFVEGARKYVAEMFPDVPDNDENKENYRNVMIPIVKATLSQDELVFTKQLVRNFKNAPDNSVFLVPDMRRRIEFDYMRKEIKDQFISVRVDRGEIEEGNFGEGDMDDVPYDFVMDNNSTLEAFESKVRMVSSEFLRRLG